MSVLRRNSRLTTIAAVLSTGVVCAAAFCYLRPYDSYLLSSWEGELSTIADGDVEVHLEQIAALGQRSLSTLVAALHSERQIVAETAADVLRRKLDELTLRSTDESSQIVAGLAHELAARSDHPGPYSARATTRLATRLLLWPINRELVDGQQLVADCELIIRSTPSSRDAIAERTDEDSDATDEVALRQNDILAAEILNPLPGGGLPVQLLDAPSLSPQDVRVANPTPASTTQPPHFIAVQAPRALDAIPILADDIATAQPSALQPATQPPAIDSRKRLELRRDSPTVPRRATDRLDLRALADLDLMRQFASPGESRAGEVIDELRRRGFQTKHLRLAELLVDPDTNVRLELVRRLPQMPGIDSRPWLLWLSRDPDPAVRQAAVAVIATSSDPALQQRVRELEREETDDEVLRVVRQVLNARQTNTIR